MRTIISSIRGSKWLLGTGYQLSLRAVAKSLSTTVRSGLTTDNE